MRDNSHDVNTVFSACIPRTTVYLLWSTIIDECVRHPDIVYELHQGAAPLISKGKTDHILGR
jgi:hypothetical protein